MCVINIEMTVKIPAVGSKAQVFHSAAKHTSGGLKKKDLMKHKGRIISRKKHAQGLKSIKHLRSLGYIAKKGTFKLFRKSMVDGRRHKKRRHTRKHGGAAGVPDMTKTGQPAGSN
jgi:hypothetical protein